MMFLVSIWIALPVSAASQAQPSGSVADFAFYGNWRYAEVQSREDRPWAVTLTPAEGEIHVQPAGDDVFVVLGATVTRLSGDGEILYCKEIPGYTETARHHLRVASSAIVGSAIVVHFEVPSSPIRSDVVALDRTTGEILGVASVKFGVLKRLVPVGGGVLCVGRRSESLYYVPLPPRDPVQVLAPSDYHLVSPSLAGKTVSFGPTVYHFRSDGGPVRLRLRESPLGEPDACFVLPGGRILAKYYFPLESDAPQRQNPYTVATSLYEFYQSGGLTHRWTFQASLEQANGIEGVQEILAAKEETAWARGAGLVSFDLSGRLVQADKDVEPLVGTRNGVVGLVGDWLTLIRMDGVRQRLARLDPKFARRANRQWTVAAGTNGLYFAAVGPTGEPSLLFQPVSIPLWSGRYGM